MIERSGGVRSVSSFASVTCGVKLNVPAANGVPEISPVSGLRVTPVGSAPENDHFSGLVPPAVTKVRLYRTETVPSGSRSADVVVISSETMVRDKVLVAVDAGFAESRTVKVWPFVP